MYCELQGEYVCVCVCFQNLFFLENLMGSILHRICFGKCQIKGHLLCRLRRSHYPEWKSWAKAWVLVQMWTVLGLYAGKDSHSWFKDSRNTFCSLMPHVTCWQQDWNSYEQRQDLGLEQICKKFLLTYKCTVAWQQYLVCVHSFTHSAPIYWYLLCAGTILGAKFPLVNQIKILTPMELKF